MKTREELLKEIHTHREHMATKVAIWHNPLSPRRAFVYIGATVETHQNFRNTSSAREDLLAIAGLALCALEYLELPDEEEH